MCVVLSTLEQNGSITWKCCIIGSPFTTEWNRKKIGGFFYFCYEEEVVARGFIFMWISGISAYICIVSNAEIMRSGCWVKFGFIFRSSLCDCSRSNYRNEILHFLSETMGRGILFNLCRLHSCICFSSNKKRYTIA